MWNWVKRTKKHLIFLGFLFAYLLLANLIDVRFFIKNGKPASTNVKLPQNTTGVFYNIVELRPIVYEGENLYELKGFAFLTSNPTQVNKITIVLNTAGQNIAFSTNSVQYPDMIESYPGFVPGMEQAEFSMLLADHVLASGTYQIGVLLENQEGPDRSYVLTSSSIKKTPNTISFVPGP